MASELRVNTLKDASGNNSVAMSTVSNGTPKGYAYWNQETPGLTDSLNASSLTDSGTGVGGINWSSGMSSASYMCTTGAPTVSSSNVYGSMALDDGIYAYQTKTTTFWPFNTLYTEYSASFVDSRGMICAAMGDLA
jgi:hypothetical protein